MIFIDGDNEIGNEKIINTDFIQENYNDLHQKYWKLYKVGIKHFFNLLPITQLYEVLSKRYKTQINNQFEEKKQNRVLKKL